MSEQIAQRDQNYVPSLIAVDSSDLSTPQLLVVDSLTNRLLVSAVITSSSALTVDGSGVTQPISATALPLPTGAATSANQSTANTSLASIDGKITAVDTGAVVLAAGTAAIGKLATNSGVDIGDVTVNNTAAAPVYTQHNITSLGHGVKTVTTAGTDVALAGSTACKRVTIQAQTDNTGLIAVGGSGVDATEATGTGIILYAGDVFELDTDNLADVFIDATVSGEGVRFTYFK